MELSILYILSWYTYLKSSIQIPLARVLLAFSLSCSLRSSRSSVCVVSAILTTGIRARRKSPRSVKMESSKIGIEKFDGSNFGF